MRDPRHLLNQVIDRFDWTIRCLAGGEVRQDLLPPPL